MTPMTPKTLMTPKIASKNSFMYTKEYLELDPADGAPVHAAEAPGGRALLGRDAGLLEDGDASRARTILLLLGIAIGNVCGLAFEHRSYGHTRWKCLLQP